MSKEYLEEALERLYKCNDDDYTLGYQQHDYKLLKQALQRLEAIDNANPSEALKCLDLLAKQIELDEDTDYWEIRNAHKTVEQALLKAQEPKKYLKWEDLEFTNEEQSIQVLLNGKKYTMFYYDDDVSFDTVVIGGVFIDCCDKQLFNDLHLERVEE